MKVKIIGALLGLIVILISISAILYNWGAQQRDERDRLFITSQKQLLEKDQSLQITKVELKQYLKQNKELDSLLKKERIKVKDVRTITQIKEIYIKGRDTLIMVKDSIPSTYSFKYDKDCLSFVGIANTRTLQTIIDSVHYENNIRMISYLKKEDTGRKILWLFHIKKKYLELHSESDCGQLEIRRLEIIKE